MPAALIGFGRACPAPDRQRSPRQSSTVSWVVVGLGRGDADLGSSQASAARDAILGRWRFPAHSPRTGSSASGPWRNGWRPKYRRSRPTARRQCRRRPRAAAARDSAAPEATSTSTGSLRQPLEPVFGDHAGIVGRAAGRHGDAAHLGPVERQGRQADGARGWIEVGLQRVADHRRLLVDLLQHEVAMVALADHRPRDAALADLAFHFLSRPDRRCSHRRAARPSRRPRGS